MSPGRRPRAPEPEPTPGPGAAALGAHLSRADGGPPAHRWRPREAHARPDQAPLDQIAGYRTDGHWHLVTYGLTETDAKESDDPGVSGWGFELSVRVPDDGERPDWAADMLTNLSVYVWVSRHAFADGHHLALSGPIKPEADTALTAAVVVTDPGVEPFAGPYGRVEFLQVVGVTEDELEACRAWSTEGVVDLLRRRDPDFLTRLDRNSVLDDPAAAAEVAERRALDGASLTELRVGTLDLIERFGRPTVLRLGAGASAALGPALRRELVGEGASFDLVGDAATVRFAVGTPGWQRNGGDLELRVDLAGVADLAALFNGSTGWGRRPELRRLRFQVIP